MSNFHTFRSLMLIIPLAGWMLAGCSHYSDASREMQYALDDARFQTQTTSHQNHPAVDAEEPGQTEATETRSSSLDTLIAESLKNNPMILAAIDDVQAKLERIPQVMALPDPYVKAMIRPEPIQTAAGDAWFTLSVNQKLPWIGRLDAAGRAAADEVEMAIERLNATRLSVIADVERSYAQLYLAERSLELTEAKSKILGDLVGVAEARYRVGQVTQQEVLSIQAEYSRLLDDKQRFSRQRESAAAALNQLRDKHPTTPVEPVPVLDILNTDRDLDQLIRLAESNNPAIGELLHQVERDEVQVELANLEYIPDIELGGEWTAVDGRDPWIPNGADPTKVNRKSEVGDDNWGMSIQVRLPIGIERIEAGRRQARMNLSATRNRLRGTRNLIAYRIFDAHSRVRSATETLDLLNTTLLPQAQQAYKITVTEYEAGRSAYTIVIDNWRRLLTLELMAHRETVNVWIALSELRREVGTGLLREKLENETGTIAIHN